MVKNEAGEFYDLSLTTCFLTSEKHSFGVHADKSPKICTHVEQIFLYKAGLLLNIDVAVNTRAGMYMKMYLHTFRYWQASA